MPWFSHSLWSLAYLRRDGQQVVRAPRLAEIFLTTHGRRAPVLTEGEGVAPPQPLVSLPVLVQVGGRLETALGPPGEHHYLALPHPGEGKGVRGVKGIVGEKGVRCTLYAIPEEDPCAGSTGVRVGGAGPHRGAF